MTHRARVLVWIVVAAAAANCWSIRSYGGNLWLRFLVYLVAVLFSSGMKVALPNSDGTMSVSFIFIFLGILQLSPLQAVTLGLASVLVQCRIKVVKSFTIVQILFNLANVSTATVFSWYSYQGLLRLHASMAPALAGAATVYYLANTIPVAAVIAFESGQKPFGTWRREFYSYFPFYVGGAALVALAQIISFVYDWWTSLLVIPVAYVMYRTYGVQVEIMASLSSRETISMLCYRPRPYIPFDGMAVYLRCGDSLKLEYLDPRITPSFSRNVITLGEGLSGWVAFNRRPIINGNPTVEPNYLQASGAMSVLNSALSIPLFKVAGETLGVLTLYAREATAFSTEHLRILQAIEFKFSLSLQNVGEFETADADSRPVPTPGLQRVPS